MQASIVAPLVGLIGFILQICFGIDLTEGQEQIIIDGLVALSLLGAFIYGGFKFYEQRKSEMEA